MVYYGLPGPWDAGIEELIVKNVIEQVSGLTGGND